MVYGQCNISTQQLCLNCSTKHPASILPPSTLPIASAAVATTEHSATTNVPQRAAMNTPMTNDDFRQHGKEMVDYIANYLENIGKRRVVPAIEPGYLRGRLSHHPPAKPESFSTIMQDVEKHIMPGVTHWQHPRFHAYFPAGNSFPSILADMLSDAMGCMGFSWAACPAMTELEMIILDWLGQMIGLPKEFLPFTENCSGGGVIQGSASECILVSLLAARFQVMKELRKKFPFVDEGLLCSKLIAYCSKEDDKNVGLFPFFVATTLGTTSCCSFDALNEIGPVCTDMDVWLHVDAAYAGSAFICPEFKHLLAGVEHAMSFNTNPNKWLLVNFDCSTMWVRDRVKLTEALVVDPLYLQHSWTDKAVDYRHWGIPLSRRFRSLKLWFVIRMYGVEGLQRYIREHVRLAKKFEQLVLSDDRFEVINNVILGLVCFRLKGEDETNEKLLTRLNSSGLIHMVPASCGDKFVIRFCVCAEKATDRDITIAWDIIRQKAGNILGSSVAPLLEEDETAAEEEQLLSVENELPPVTPGADDALAASTAARNSASLAQKRSFFVRMVSDPKCYNPKIVHHLKYGTTRKLSADLRRDLSLRHDIGDSFALSRSREGTKSDDEIDFTSTDVGTQTFTGVA